MSKRTGIYFFRGSDPAEFEQSLSLAEEALDGLAEEIVEKVLDDAVTRMQKIIADGGINKTQKGGPRIDSGDMFSSVGSEMLINKRGRVQASFGFINDAPLWTRFQERGTRALGPMRNRGSGGGGGIAPMLAYATALEEAIVDFQNRVDSVEWSSFSTLSMIDKRN